MNEVFNCPVVVETRPNRGTWNMAVDEALLQSGVMSGLCAVRIYRWSEATVSLGYFQNRATFAAASELMRLPAVRRLSGGGAILHHHEITYSCVVPADHPLARAPVELYRAVHDCIIAILKHLGVEARQRGTADKQKDAAALCFARGDPRDVVIGGHKILGSAQRRRRGAVLQHGSLLLRRSSYAPQFSGVLDMGFDCLVDDAVSSRLGSEIGRLLGDVRVVDEVDDDVRQRAIVLEETRYPPTLLSEIP